MEFFNGYVEIEEKEVKVRSDMSCLPQTGIRIEQLWGPEDRDRIPVV